MEIVIEALEDLINQNYIYFSTFKVEHFVGCENFFQNIYWGKASSRKLREVNSATWNTLDDNKKLKMLVIYFDDNYIGMMAEKFKLKARMTQFDARS